MSLPDEHLKQPVFTTDRGQSINRSLYILVEPLQTAIIHCFEER